MMAALLSGGQSTHQIGQQADEYAVSQVFIAIDVTSLVGQTMLNNTLDAIIQDLHSASALDQNEDVRYPGQGMLRTRQESLEKGVLVDEELWQALRSTEFD